jgi:hypothetical protein
MSPIKGIFVFTTLAFATFAAGSSSRFTLSQPTVIAGEEFKPGDYRVEWNGEKATIKGEKQSVEATVKVETGTQRFSGTAIRYETTSGKAQLNEIWIGGTKTKLIIMDRAGGSAGQPAGVR